MATLTYATSPVSLIVFAVYLKIFKKLIYLFLLFIYFLNGDVDLCDFASELDCFRSLFKDF